MSIIVFCFILVLYSFIFFVFAFIWNITSVDFLLIVLDYRTFVLALLAYFLIKTRTSVNVYSTVYISMSFMASEKKNRNA